MKIKVEKFTQGKNEPKNEDYFSHNEISFVLSDGSTDKSGQTFDGKTGGEILSRLLVKEALATEKNGIDLIRNLTEKIRELYIEINPDALEEATKRFSATFICTRVTNNKVIVTLVGDSVCRINGVESFSSPMLIDEINIETRKNYILKTNDIEGARDFIFPMLKSQVKYQNNPDSPLGYGSLDGTFVPEKFINVFEFPIEKIKTIELVSDGYMELPDEISIDAYEKLYKHINEVDPYKYKEYPALKFNDDRTIVILTLE